MANSAYHSQTALGVVWSGFTLLIRFTCLNIQGLLQFQQLVTEICQWIIIDNSPIELFHLECFDIKIARRCCWHCWKQQLQQLTFCGKFDKVMEIRLQFSHTVCIFKERPATNIKYDFFFFFFFFFLIIMFYFCDMLCLYFKRRMIFALKWLTFKLNRASWNSCTDQNYFGRKSFRLIVKIHR